MKDVREIRVGDSIFLKDEPYGMVVSSYGLNEQGWFICCSPATVHFKALDQIKGWADPETHFIHPVDISTVPDLRDPDEEEWGE